MTLGRKPTSTSATRAAELRARRKPRPAARALSGGRTSSRATCADRLPVGSRLSTVGPIGAKPAAESSRFHGLSGPTERSTGTARAASAPTAAPRTSLTSAPIKNAIERHTEFFRPRRTAALTDTARSIGSLSPFDTVFTSVTGISARYAPSRPTPAPTRTTIGFRLWTTSSRSQRAEPTPPTTSGPLTACATPGAATGNEAPAALSSGGFPMPRTH